jgi:pyrroline-5-carboxylate reductase
MPVAPILILGAGRMGGALIEGWGRNPDFDPQTIMVRDPQVSPVIKAAGVVLNPPDSALILVKTVLLAVKPQIWREAAAAVAPHLAMDAVIVSIVAGVGSAAISQAFGGRRVARVMPTTAVAIGRGTASIYAPTAEVRDVAHALFAGVGKIVDLADEDLLHAATGVSGSAPAYFYTFIEGLETAGARAGLTVEQSKALARSTILGAAALMDSGTEEPADLRRQVTSPNGTTQAALDVLMKDRALEYLLTETVAACIARSRVLAGS